MSKGFVIWPILLIAIIIFVAGVFYSNTDFRQESTDRKRQSLITPSPEPTLLPYSVPTLPDEKSYRIILLGDSMTEAFGINANPLRLELIDLYPEKEFVTYNYSVPSSNILSLPSRLENSDVYLGESLPPIYNQGFDLIIIESFAYNPLSKYSIEEGLSQQEQILEDVVKKLIRDRPNSIIAFMTTIAPDKDTFASASRDLSEEQRKQWIEEREAYIQNHIDFAEENNIPLIDVYQRSIELPVDERKELISSDTIHPSEKGIEFISEEMARYIYDNQLIPH